MKYSLHTLLLTGMVIMPVAANAQSLISQTDSNTYVMAQNLTTPQLNAIKEGRVTNNGQAIPVETKIMMSTGNLDGYTVRKVQQSLSDRGYYKGKITGKWDSETASSVASFQRASGDSVDESGKLISSGTLARLGVTLDKLTAGDANSEVSRNPDLAKETRGLAGSQMSPPGKTVPAPDNGPKSTLTRDAVASGKFNETIDGSHARGTTDANTQQNNTTANNPTSGIAGTRNAPVTAGSSVVGNSNLSAGSTSSASVQTTGSLQATAAPQSGGSISGNGTATNNVDGRTGPGSPSTTSSAVGGRTAGSLSNNSTGTSGIANSGGSLTDGAGSGTTRSGSLSGGGSSGASAGTGSLSSSGGGSAGGGGL